MGRQDQDFAREAEKRQVGFLRELFDFMRDNKKWWLTPVILALLVVTAIVVLGGTAAAPFIYTLF